LPAAEAEYDGNDHIEQCGTTQSQRCQVTGQQQDERIYEDMGMANVSIPGYQDVFRSLNIELRTKKNEQEPPEYVSRRSDSQPPVRSRQDEQEVRMR
jgi:hypothetical protein